MNTVIKCSLLGEPSCIIYLDSNYSDKNVFNSEKQRIQDMAIQVYSLDNGTLLYSTDDNLEKYLELYTDDLTEDGRKYIFEFAVVDDESQSIEYLFAVQQDGQSQNETILNLSEGIAVN